MSTHRTPMTSVNLAVFRLFNITFGRFAPFARMFRRALERRLIYRAYSIRYVPSSRFFHPDELD